MRWAVMAAAVVAGLAFAPRLAGAAGMTAIATTGKGTLTLCRSWIVYRSCKSYDKVALPTRIAVGDRVTLTFGSNPNSYAFTVVEIRPKGDGCLLLSEQSGGSEDGERLELSPCRPAPSSSGQE
jgi:hypothetical protein